MANRIVIVDDDRGFCRMLCRLIESNQWGTVLEVCHHGAEAEAVLVKCQPDTVIVSWLLPGQSGVELVRKLKNRPDALQEAQVIMTSAYMSEAVIAEASQAGVDVCMSKPLNVLDVAATLERNKNKPVRTQGAGTSTVVQKEISSMQMKMWNKLASLL